MKQVKIKDSFFEKCIINNTKSELMFNRDGRPCVLIIRLKYKGTFHKFVVPMRSNISPTTPRKQYFSLPPNASTKPYHTHGIHYIKLFPVVDKFVSSYKISSKYDLMVKSIIDRNESVIVRACQEYLTNYENGEKNSMTPDIDGILSWLYSD